MYAQEKAIEKPGLPGVPTTLESHRPESLHLAGQRMIQERSQSPTYTDNRR